MKIFLLQKVSQVGICSDFPLLLKIKKKMRMLTKNDEIVENDEMKKII